MYYGRTENRIKNPYNLSDMYTAYEEEFKDNPVYAVERSRFYTLCGEYYKAVMEEVMRNGRVFNMPYSIGSIEIIKYKPALTDIRKRTSFIDWKNTAKIGKIVYHLNEHTNGFKFSIKWKRKKNVIRYIEIYKFVPTRAIKRSLAQIIKNKETDYFETN